MDFRHGRIGVDTRIIDIISTCRVSILFLFFRLFGWNRRRRRCQSSKDSRDQFRRIIRISSSSLCISSKFYRSQFVVYTTHTTSTIFYLSLLYDRSWYQTTIKKNEIAVNFTDTTNLNLDRFLLYHHERKKIIMKHTFIAGFSVRITKVETCYAYFFIYSS